MIVWRNKRAAGSCLAAQFLYPRAKCCGRLGFQPDRTDWKFYPTTRSLSISGARNRRGLLRGVESLPVAAVLAHPGGPCFFLIRNDSRCHQHQNRLFFLGVADVAEKPIQVGNLAHDRRAEFAATFPRKAPCVDQDGSVVG